jgi:GDP-L-fucose synthase
VLHLAADVGGIGYNLAHPGQTFYANVMMGALVLEQARRAGVGKIVAVGSVCAYPEHARVPFREEELWDGYPEPTNGAYGSAKRMLLVQGQAYRAQYGLSVVHLLMMNLYGPGDHFEAERSHVIPALVRRFLDAAAAGAPEIVVWGDGLATREFLYVDDAARGIVLAAERYDDPAPVNLGAGFEISVRDLATLIAELTGYHGRLVFDASKPSGQRRRSADVSRAKREFGFEAEVGLREGLARTIDWYSRTQAAAR